MKKILFILPTITQTNGVAAFIENYLRHMNLDGLDISIICGNLRPSESRLAFFKSKGIKITLLPYIRETNLIVYLSEIYKFFKVNNNFDLIYSNIAYQSILFFAMARLNGMKNFAIHSHASEASDNKVKNIVGKIIQAVTNNCVHGRFACSELAGKAMFGNDSFTVINNAIEYEKYKFNNNYRKDIRSQIGVADDVCVIGFVGRYAAQKNVFFFIELAEKLDSEYKILMIGTGQLKEQFCNAARERGIYDSFIFVEETNTVEKYYSAMDVFMLPSFFEGLPVTGIEAQANGVPCIFSDTITEECKISDNVSFLSIKSMELWVEEIKKAARRDQVKLDKAYDITVQSQIFRKEIESVC